MSFEFCLTKKAFKDGFERSNKVRLLWKDWYIIYKSELYSKKYKNIDREKTLSTEPYNQLRINLDFLEQRFPGSTLEKIFDIAIRSWIYTSYP